VHGEKKEFGVNLSVQQPSDRTIRVQGSGPRRYWSEESRKSGGHRCPGTRGVVWKKACKEGEAVGGGMV